MWIMYVLEGLVLTSPYQDVHASMILQDRHAIPVCDLHHVMKYLLWILALTHDWSWISMQCLAIINDIEVVEFIHILFLHFCCYNAWRKKQSQKMYLSSRELSGMTSSAWTGFLSKSVFLETKIYKKAESCVYD